MENQIDVSNKTTTNDQDTFEVGGLILKRNPGRHGYDLTGGKFGRLTVIKQVESIAKDKNKSAKYWMCKCECGNIVEHVRADSLLQGKQKSCGCKHEEHIHNIGKITHRQKYPKRGSYTKNQFRLLKILRNYIKYCYNSKDKAYQYYGGKGIKVYQEWLDDQTKFVDYIENQETYINLLKDKLDIINGKKTIDDISITNNDNTNNNTSECSIDTSNIYYNNDNINLNYLKHIDITDIKFYITRIDKLKDFEPGNIEILLYHDKSKKNAKRHNHQSSLLTIDDICKSIYDWAKDIEISSSMLHDILTNKGQEYTIDFIKKTKEALDELYKI